MAKGLEWIKISTDIAFDGDVENVSDSAFRTFIELVATSGYLLTDGELPLEIARKRCNTHKVQTALRELEEVGLITIEEGRISILKYTKYQQTREEVEAQRERTRERVRRYRESGNDDSNGDSNGVSTPAPARKSKSNIKEQGASAPDYVGHAVDYAKSKNLTLDGSMKARIGKAAKEQANGGAAASVIRSAIEKLLDDNKPPNQLGYLVRDLQSGGGIDAEEQLRRMGV